ncbi:MAG: NAD(P)-binding domain-containing protein [Acidobacteriota bacterium]|nr:NAD(P)-binding domain-containing protein [Blastocatellia bacterium]MDW8412057.1 NAD(P)-binding domain-containing protein [Acidobacteriota bacterium]
MPGKKATAKDVIIVGAGAAGIGVGAILKQLGIDFVILERSQIGASFLSWPEEMRFITPSFTSNSFGLLDLNAIALSTSPAYTLGTEHPSGKEYARYLQSVALHFKLPIRTQVNVEKIEPTGNGFLVHSATGQMQCKFVIWAAGEFQYPNTTSFEGSTLCRHSSTVSSWKEFVGEDFTVIGGGESGIDAAINLALKGKKVRVLDGAATWNIRDPDPSLTLSPNTKDRLKHVNIELIAKDVKRVKHNGSEYIIYCQDGQQLYSPTQPILATGFSTSLVIVKELFEFDSAGRLLLTENDESSRTPGLFLVGPQVQHEGIIFCFIYKFRQRFAIVANAIAQRLGTDTSLLAEYKKHNMYLDDLSCCDDGCAC